MSDFNRADRVGDTIQRELARLIQTKVRDPRLGMVSINAVRVSDDIRHAKVYVTFIEDLDQAEKDQQVAILNKAAGFLRSELHNSIILRLMPRLHFQFDESIERASRISALIDSVVTPAPEDDPSDNSN